MTDKFGQGLRGAANYAVSRDMVQLLLAAADGLDDEDFIDVSLVPTPSGFVRFETPIKLIDIRGVEMKAHYLIWVPVATSDGEGLLLTWFNDAQDPDEVEVYFRNKLTEEQLEIVVRELGDWRWIGSDVVLTGQRLGSKVIVPRPELVALVEKEDGVPAQASTNMIRISHALWLMLEQTITVVREEPAERAATRRAKKKNLPSGVTVVQLRRAEYVGGSQHGHSDVVWKHRWIVRGHWRWQVCGPNHKLAQEISEGVYRARIWISPFVKGPEGAELVVTEKINVLNR